MSTCSIKEQKLATLDHLSGSKRLVVYLTEMSKCISSCVRRRNVFHWLLTKVIVLWGDSICAWFDVQDSLVIVVTRLHVVSGPETEAA